MCVCIYIYIYIYITFVGVTVSFNQSTYSVDEDEISAQLGLVLSNPSSLSDITVQIFNTDGLATGKQLSNYIRTYVLVMTWHEKTGLMYTKYAYLYYSMYLLYCLKF